MGKYISGEITVKISFHDVYVEDGNGVVDSIFPDGWDGEMINSNYIITKEEFAEEDEE